MNVTFAALTVLHQMMLANDPLCGAELIRSLKMSSGTLYPLLKRLKDEGWIELIATLPHPNQPASHFYTITLKGRANFLDMLCRLTIPNYLWRDQPEGVSEEYRKLPSQRANGIHGQGAAPDRRKT